MLAMNKGIKAYQQGNIKSTLAAADPHKVIQMLMDGALQRLAQAKGALERNDLPGKSEALSKASAIIRALMEGVDTEVGGDISTNLLSIYDYILGSIGEASITNDTQFIDEAMSVLLPIKGAWDQISDVDKETAYAKRAEIDAQG